MSGVPSLRDQLAQARRAGLVVRPVRRTGEVRVLDQCCDGVSVRVNARRKDGVREVARMISRHLEGTVLSVAGLALLALALAAPIGASADEPGCGASPPPAAATDPTIEPTTAPPTPDETTPEPPADAPEPAAETPGPTPPPEPPAPDPTEPAATDPPAEPVMAGAGETAPPGVTWLPDTATE